MSIPHGSESGYLNHGCRCDQCRQALKSARLRRATSPDAKHGTKNTYTNGCRCNECSQAHASYQRELVSRKRRNRALTAALEAGA